MEKNIIYHEDCIQGMSRLPDKSIDMILCDLPYGLTNADWDKKIPLEELWKQYKRVIKDNGMIALFAIQPFATELIQSNKDMFRFEIVWVKSMKLGFQNCNRMPLRQHENIYLFYKKLPVYHPQKHFSTKPERIGTLRIHKGSNQCLLYHDCLTDSEYVDDGTRYPTDVLFFLDSIYEQKVTEDTTYSASNIQQEFLDLDDVLLFPNPNNGKGTLGKIDNPNVPRHTTQKPVPLCEYLIRTFTNVGDVVLDNCIGSGTTAIACINTQRNYIGFEIDKKYYQIAIERIQGARKSDT